MKDVLKKWIFVILAGVIAFGVITTGVMTSKQNDARLMEQTAKIQQLRGELVVKEAAAQKQREEASQVATGVNFDRKKKDDEIARTLFKAAFTWNSYQTYMDARTKVMSLGIPADSPFLKTVLPAVENRVDPSGKSYNLIDTQGLTMAYSTMESRVSMVKVTDYSYFSLLETKTSSKQGEQLVTSYYAVSYTTDTNGKILAITVDLVPAAPLTEG